MAVSTPTLIATHASSANATTRNITVGSTVPAGTFVFVVFVCSSRGATLGISDSKSNTWTILGPFLSTNTGTASATILAYTTLNASGWGAADTVTPTNTVTGSAAVFINSLTGVDTASPIDVTASGATNASANTAWAAPALTPAVGSLSYGFGSLGSSTALNSITSGYTQDQLITTTVSNIRSAYGMYRQIATSASQTPAGTLGALVIWEAISVSFRTLNTGTFAATEGNDTLASSGSETITGTAAPSEAADTLAASGGETITGTLSTSEAADTLAASGAETIAGTLATTEGNDTLAASGSSTTAITGAFTATEAADTLAGSGTEQISGTFASTEGTDTLAAAGTESITGTLSGAEGADALAAAGTSGFPRDLTLVAAALPPRLTGTAARPRITGATRPARLTGHQER